MLTSLANEMIVTNYIPPTSRIYICNGTTDSLARRGENSLEGWEVMSFHVWWPGKEVVCMCM